MGRVVRDAAELGTGSKAKPLSRASAPLLPHMDPAAARKKNWVNTHGARSSRAPHVKRAITSITGDKS